MKVVTADTDSWYALLAKAQEARIIEAFERFRDVRIEPILIKGWAAARWYPDGQERRPGDIDLIVAPSDFEQAHKLWRQPDISNLFIDLHNGLSQLDPVEWNDLFGRSILVDLNGTAVRVLSPEDHLRVLCTHWLIDGGRYKDKLWDIYYAIDNRPADFDWTVCLDVIAIHRGRWVECVIAIVHEYLGLDINDLPFADATGRIPPWVRGCIEREWNRRDDLEPVLASVHDKGLLLRQVSRRLPPNPIRATIEANGDLYGSRRWLYQMLVLARRIGPFTRDSVSFIKNRLGSD